MFLSETWTNWRQKNREGKGKSESHRSLGCLIWGVKFISVRLNRRSRLIELHGISIQLKHVHLFNLSMIKHCFSLLQMEKVREKVFKLQLEKGKRKRKIRERERKDSSFFHLSVFCLERLHHTHSHTSLSLSLWRRSFFYLINTHTHTHSLSLSLWVSRPSLKVSEGAPNNTVSSTLSHTYIFLVNCSSNFQWQYILMLNC